MTTELEKQFFETFGIEPKSVKRTLKLAMPGYDESDLPKDLRQFISSQAQVYHVYPQITDRILLELILINMHNEDLFGYPTNIQELKDNTLKQLIETYNKFSTCVTYDGEYQQTARKIKHQISILFEEE